MKAASVAHFIEVGSVSGSDCLGARSVLLSEQKAARPEHEIRRETPRSVKIATSYILQSNFMLYLQSPIWVPT